MLRSKSFYLNQNQVFKVNSVSGVVLDIKKTTNKFRGKKKMKMKTAPVGIIKVGLHLSCSFCLSSSCGLGEPLP